MRHPSYYLQAMVLVTAAMLFGAGGRAAADAVYQFSVNTSALAADAADQPFALQLLLVSGTDNTTNHLTLSNFQFGGGSADAVLAPFGNVTGDASGTVNLDDIGGTTSGLIQNFTPGSALSFTISTTADLGINDPVNGLIPDSFSLQILDSTGIAIPTTDSSSVTFLSINYGQPALEVQTAASDPTVATSGGATLTTGDPTLVPEASAAPLPPSWLMGLPLMVGVAVARRRFRYLEQA